MCSQCEELKSDLHWSDICILPIAAGMAVANEIGKSPSDGFKVSALYAWRKYKEIYSFDSDLADMLFEQADEDLDIPIEILMQIPYPCIYIEFHETGFFAYFEHDVNNHQFEFRMYVIEGECEYPLILHIEKKWSVVDALNETYKEAKKRSTPEYNYIMDKYKSDLAHKAAELLQFVLYICAENSDRAENPTQSNITRRTKDSEKHPKDVIREIRKWDMGYRIGSQIRRMKSDDSQKDGTNSGSHAGSFGSRKSPHARRGHWHHFWIGKHNTDERRLILKWVAPMFIGGDDDDNITTIHPVK